MTLPECSRCGRPDPTGGRICAPCAQPLTMALLQLADLAGETDVNVARLASYGPRSGPRSSTPALPVDLDASAAAWAAAHVVVTWMDHVATVRGLPLPTPDRHPAPGRRPIGPLCADAGWATLEGQALCQHPSCDAIRPHRRRRPHPVGAAARWLAGQVWWLRRSADAEDAFAELLDAADEVRRLVENPSDRWYAGLCWALVDGDPPQRCPADLYAWPGAGTVRCPACGTVHQTGARMRWLLDEARTQRGTATQLATAVVRLGRQATAGQLRAHASRGRLPPALVALADGVHGPLQVDRDEWDRVRYRLGDVLDLLDQVAVERQADREAKARRAEEREEKARRAERSSGSSTSPAPTVS